MYCIKIALRRSFFEKTVQSIANGTDKGESFITVVRLETKLRATLTEQQKALFKQIKKRMQKLRPAWATSVHKRISICIAADDGSLRADT